MIGGDMENQDLTPMVSQGKWFQCLKIRHNPPTHCFPNFFMDLLIHIATPHSRGVLDHLAKACARSGIQWACFLTNDGVKLLEVQSIQQALSAADALIVCKHAWNLHLPGKECPAEFGSQSDNSHLMGRCRKVISL